MTARAPRIGIIVCDHYPADLEEVAAGTIGDRYRLLLGVGEFLFREYDATVGELPRSRDECDAWIITGSRADTHGDEPWVLALLDWIRTVVSHVRMVGICFGHQAIAEALGGKVERAAGWKVGPQVLELDGRPWFDPQAISLQAMHRDEVTQLPPGVTRVANGTTATTPAFLIGDHTLCIQDHPEFDAAIARHLIRARADLIGSVTAEAGLARCDETPTSGDLMGGWLAAFLLDRRS